VAELNAIRVSDAPFDVGSMSIPALFGRGGRSIPHHREGVAWLVEHTPNAQLYEVPGAAHGAHLSHPDGFADFVRRAVERAGEVAATTEPRMP
jgi:pimeloyl-ACP methyl ester carboxylesterase